MSELLTIKDVCQILKLKPWAIYNMVRHGEIPFTKIGRSLRFERGQIDEWIKRSSVAPKCEASQ